MKWIPKSAWTDYNIRYHQNRQVEAWTYYPKRLNTVNCIIWPQTVYSFSFTAIPMERNQCQSLQKKTQVKSQTICWVWGSLIWYKFYPQGKQPYLLVSQLYIPKVDLKCSSKEKTLSFGSNTKLHWFCSWMPLVGSLQCKFEPWVGPICAHGLQGSASRAAAVSLVTSTYQYAAKRQVHLKTRTTFTHHSETECCH